MNAGISRRARYAPLLLLLLAGGPARANSDEASAGPNPFLGQARQLYEAVRYEECLLRIQQAGQWKNTHTELVQIEIYGGLCQFALGRVREAQAHFVLALQLDPAAQPPPLTSPKVMAAFERARAEATQMGAARPGESSPTQRSDDPPPAQPTSDIPREVALSPSPELLPQPPIVSPSPPSRERHRIPRASWYLGAGSVLGAGSAAYLWSRAKHYEGRANSEPIEGRAFDLGASARSRAQLAYGSMILSAGLAAAAVWLYFDVDEAPAP